MSTVLGAIHAGPGADAILTTTKAVGELLGVEPRALHVRANGVSAPCAAAASAELKLELREGPVVDAITAAAERHSVRALVLGARGGRSLAGHTALQVMTRVQKPLVIVPPVVARNRVQRLLVALEGTAQTADAIAGLLRAARQRDLDIVLLHVHPLGELPLFEDQPQHEHEAWTHEFVRRWCPPAGLDCRFELRVGAPGERLVEVAHQTDADLIVLSWSRDLTPGHAAVVREAIADGRVPTLLLPILDLPGEENGRAAMRA